MRAGKPIQREQPEVRGRNASPVEPDGMLWAADRAAAL